jgi:AraC-like DNA-binding protein/quercetin dioxygenase-like cupin family protein
MAKRTLREYKSERLGNARIIDPDKITRSAFVLFERYASHRGPPHKHRKGQLIYVSEGVLRVKTNAGMWVVLPQRGVWVPPEVVHLGVSRRSFALCTLYVDADHAQALPKHSGTVTITPLVRELLLQCAQFGWHYSKSGPRMRLLSVLVEQIATLPHAPLHLPQPKDRRLCTIAAALYADPACNDTLDNWASRVGASRRTLARLFVRETNLTFAAWRRQLRLLVALEALAHGQSVTAAALGAGYQDTSAFVSMFRRALGTTPGHYFDVVRMNLHQRGTSEQKSLKQIES